MRKIETLTSYPPLHVIFDRLHEKEDAVFLDSSLKGELGRYSIAAFRPYLKLEKRENLYINGTASEESFEAYLDAFLRTHYEENETDLPLVSGGIGYFTYDYGREKEGVVSRHTKSLDIPDAVMVFYDAFIVEDLHREKLYLIANGLTQQAETLLPQIRRITEEASRAKTYAEEPVSGKRIVTPDFTHEDYKAAVAHMIDYITEGDIYVVNMTQQLVVESPVQPYAMFKRLRSQNPSPFGGYLDYGDVQIVCASPERFLRVQDRRVYTRPIKGTRKRGQTAAEDAALKAELACSEKDQSELLMIVDLERNDLNRVCIPGSVKVTELFQVETYATVFHLVANVEGLLAPQNQLIDLLRAAFPGGSITGAPKLRAMELIDQEEHSRRNLYTGSIGYLSLNGDCDLNIVIRTAVYKDGKYHIGAGGGITCESDLEFEYEETWQKAAALLRALEAEGARYENRTG